MRILIALALLLLCSCATSHFTATTEDGDKVVVHDIDGGNPMYYPGMVVWDLGVAWPVTIADNGDSSPAESSRRSCASASCFSSSRS